MRKKENEMKNKRFDIFGRELPSELPKLLELKVEFNGEVMTYSRYHDITWFGNAEPGDGAKIDGKEVSIEAGFCHHEEEGKECDGYWCPSLVAWCDGVPVAGGHLSMDR